MFSKDQLSHDKNAFIDGMLVRVKQMKKMLGPRSMVWVKWLYTSVFTLLNIA